MSLPNNPAVTSTLRRSKQSINPQGYHARAVVLGFAKLGTRNQIYTLRSEADLSQFGNGEGIEAAAEIGSQAGWPVNFVPVEGTGQTPSAITKTAASGAVPKTLYGQILLTGAANGSMLFRALVAGGTLTVQTGGALAAAVNGTAVLLTIPAATTATAVDTFYNGVDPGATAARAIFTDAIIGTGAGNAGTTLATTSADAGGLTFRAPDNTNTYRVRIQMPGINPTASPTAVYAGNDLTLTHATDAAGTPLTTADQFAALPAVTGGVILVSSGGTGLAGPAAAYSTLQYGSTAAMTVSGTAPDDLAIVVVVTRGGTIGNTGLAFQWSADGGVSFSSDIAIPVSGIKLLSDGVLNTGLTVTFTGVLEVGDKWTFTAARPVVAPADILLAVDGVCAATSYKLGFLLPMFACDKTNAALIDAKLQAAYQNMRLRAVVNVRDFNNAETRSQFEAALGNDFVGFVSAHGLVRVAAGHYSSRSTYTGRIYRRPISMIWAGRRCAIAVHQDPMEKELGQLPNIQFVKDASGIVTNPGIYYDAFPNGALPSQRFICLRTWPGEEGAFYVNTSPTMGDASDVGYSLVPYSDFVIECDRIAAAELTEATIGKSFRTIPRPENDLIPAGAIDVRDCNALDARINTVLKAYMYGVKTDGNVSASDMPPGEKPYRTRRDYSYASLNPAIVKGRLNIYLRPIALYVELDVQPVLPG